MKRGSYLLVSLMLLVAFSINSFGQHKELEKLRGMVSKGKMEKAQAYCDKVTAAMSPKKSERFYAVLAGGYYRNDNFEQAAENVLQSHDKKLAEKLAKEFANKNNEFYDLSTAAELYKKAEKYVEAAEALFQLKKYEDAAKTCSSPAKNKEFGNQLFEKGEIDNALHFFKRAKKKGERFTDEKVLNYYYQKKDYATVYKILDFNEGDFKMHIQGSVFDKMLENNEPMPFIRNFLDSINIANNKQDEVIVEGYINNEEFDKAEEYCLTLKKPYDKIALTFMAEKTVNTYPNVSASANIKIGKSYMAKNLLSTYMINEAIKLNDEWEGETIDKKLIETYYKTTKPWIEKCNEKYCEFLTRSIGVCIAKVDELKTDKNQADAHKKASTFLKQVKTSNCK